MPVMALVAYAIGAAGAQPSVPPTAILREHGGSVDKRWHWIEVEPARSSSTGWVSVTGTAKVLIRGSYFRAELRLDPGEAGAEISLNGAIHNGRIRATETLLNTDASPVTVRGTLHRQSIGSLIDERIAFRGGQSGDLSYLGLYRQVPAVTRRSSVNARYRGAPGGM